MTWEFKVGQKVVCVDDTYEQPGWKFIPNRPVRNGIYTVRVFQVEPGCVAILLTELINPPKLWSDGETCEGAFDTRRFRPLVTDTQSWLKEILETPPPVKVPHSIEMPADGWMG